MSWAQTRVGRDLVNRAADEHDALFEEPLVDVRSWIGTRTSSNNRGRTVRSHGERLPVQNGTHGYLAVEYLFTRGDAGPLRAWRNGRRAGFRSRSPLGVEVRVLSPAPIFRFLKAAASGVAGRRQAAGNP